MTQGQVRNLHFTCSTGRTRSYGPGQSLSALSCSQAFRQNLNRIHTPSHKSHKRCNFHSMVLWSTLAISDHKNRLHFVAMTVLEGPPLLLVSLEIYCPTSNVSNTNHHWCLSRLLVLLHGILSAQYRTTVYWYTISGLGLQCSLLQALATFNYFLHHFFMTLLDSRSRGTYTQWYFESFESSSACSLFLQIVFISCQSRITQKRNWKGVPFLCCCCLFESVKHVSACSVWFNLQLLLKRLTIIVN